MVSEITGRQAIQQSEHISLRSLLGYFAIVYFLASIGSAILFAVIDLLIGADTGLASAIGATVFSGYLLARRVRLKEGAYADKAMIRYLSRVTIVVPLGLACLFAVIILIAFPEISAPLMGIGTITLAVLIGIGILISFLVHFLFLMLGMSSYNKWHKRRMEKEAGQ